MFCSKYSLSILSSSSINSLSKLSSQNPRFASNKFPGLLKQEEHQHSTSRSFSSYSYSRYWCHPKGYTFNKGKSLSVLSPHAGLRSGASNLIVVPTPSNQYFHTSSRKDAIPPLILLVATKLGKLGAAVAGRQFRNWWWKSLPPEQRAEYVATARNNRKYLYGLIALLGLGGYGYYQAHMEETPLTGRSRLLLFSDEQIDEISKHELDMLVETHKKNILDRSDPRHKKVYDVAIRLVTANQDLLQKYGKNKNWTVSVVDDKTVNAFVLSCGNIFVFTGLLSLCDDKDGDAASRLAIILGHELSHVLLNHSAEQASLLHFLDLLLIVPVVILWTLLPSDATAALSQWVVGKLTDLLITLPFGRNLEKEADVIGLMLAARACFDVREIVIWKKMQLMNNSTDDAVEIFSTHPSEGNRFEMLLELLPIALAERAKSSCSNLPFFDMAKRIKNLEDSLAVKKQDILVPLIVSPK